MQPYARFKGFVIQLHEVNAHNIGADFSTAGRHFYGIHWVLHSFSSPIGPNSILNQKTISRTIPKEKTECPCLQGSGIYSGNQACT